MLKTWNLQHFKSVSNRTELELAPLTIFAGANSSGKSTLIQSILLTAQTLQHPVRSRSIILNGHIVRLGDFKDVLSNTYASNDIAIGFQLASTFADPQTTLGRIYYSSSTPKAFPTIDCEFIFSAGNSSEAIEALQQQPRLEQSKITTILKDEETTREEEILIRRSKKSISERLAEYQLSDKVLQRLDTAYLEYEVVKANIPRERIAYYGYSHADVKQLGISCIHFLPEKIYIIYDIVEAQARQLVDAFITGDEQSYWDIEADERERILNNEFKVLYLQTVEACLEEEALIKEPKISISFNRLKTEFSISNAHDLLYALDHKISWISRMFDKRKDLLNAAKVGRSSVFLIESTPLTPLSDFATDYTQDFFTRLVRYLGPLRNEPKPVYPPAGATDPKDVGVRGEHTAAVLDMHKKTSIEYIPSAQLASTPLEQAPKKVLLIEAVQDWLDYMGVASSVNTVDKGKLGHEMRVQIDPTDLPHDLTHVGVGVSQILPILVLALLAEQGSTLIFEQPELHLHPRVQTRLADFFISMTWLKKQCIIETHSEYLINRLRYLSATSEGDHISNSINIYFVEKEQGQSTYQLIKVNKFGVIENWPKGFFDESEEMAEANLRMVARYLRML